MLRAGFMKEKKIVKPLLGVLPGQLYPVIIGRSVANHVCQGLNA